MANKIVATVTNSWFDVVEGQEYTIMKEYWYNGETWYKVKDIKGNIKDIPTVFFILGK